MAGKVKARKRDGDFDFAIGGVWVSPTRRKRWRFERRGNREIQAMPCKSEQWFVVQAASAGVLAGEVQIEFEDAEGLRYSRVVPLHAPQTGKPARQLGFSLGWAQAPAHAKTVRLAGWPDGQLAENIALRALAERDTKCHPLANVPTWSTYKPPFPIDRVVLPRSLAALEPLIDFAAVKIVDRPASLRKLAATAMGAAIVIDPAWIDGLNLSLADLERIVPITWMVLDLASIARLTAATGAADARIATRRSRFGLMSARVEYAEVPTRGFALMDVFPFGAYDPERGFSARVLVSNRSWRKYAESSGFAMLLGSQTPFVSQCNDVVSAMRAIGQGEMVATDLPWIVKGDFGPPVAAALAAHALRMHLGGALHEDARYWNRWDDMRVVVRDIADFVRRYPSFRALRWKSPRAGVASLGLALDCRVDGQTRPVRQFAIETGRIDFCERHDGVAPEPMMILMRTLSSEWQRRTAWAEKHLAGTEIVWQFEAAEGQRYATLYDAASGLNGTPSASARGTAAGLPDARSTSSLRIQSSPTTIQVGAIRVDGVKSVLEVPAEVGIFGDRSIDFQQKLTAQIRKWIAKE